MVLIATTASCTPVRDNSPDYTYSTHRSDSVALCKDAVTTKINRDKGHGMNIQFDRPEVFEASRRIDTVEGRGVLRDNRRYTNFEYRCDINVDSNRVVRTDVDYQYDADDNQLVRVCQDQIRDKVHKEVGPGARLNFKPADTEQLSRRQVRISGEYDVSLNNRTGKMSYQCEINKRIDKIASYSNRWLIPLSAPVRANEQDCHDAVLKKARRNGADRVKIESTERERSSRDQVKIYGDAALLDGRQWKSIEYVCRINTRSDRLETVNYKFKSGGSGPVHSMKGNQHIESLCKKALTQIALTSSPTDERRVRFIDFASEP
ncbi:MAG: hypothetical protein C0631_17910 [Sedimenticola sp.]|nr:MAG: hypothetical protein C0631_17910 [Sedimenticola sp.]